MQSLQGGIDSSIVDVGEEKRRLNLAFFHVSDEGVRIGRAREAHAVTPYRIDELAGLGRHAAQIGIEIAVEIRLEDQIARFQVFFTGWRPDEDHVIHHNETSQIRAGDFCERTSAIARKLRKIPAQFHRMTDIDTRNVYDARRKNG